MSEEELYEGAEALPATEAQEEEAEEVIDLNAALLEVMVKRTEVLERLLRGEASLEKTIAELESVAMPQLGRRRRRKTS